MPVVTAPVFSKAVNRNGVRKLLVGYMALMTTRQEAGTYTVVSAPRIRMMFLTATAIPHPGHAPWPLTNMSFAGMSLIVPISLIPSPP
jgi:hypothetical protein